MHLDVDTEVVGGLADVVRAAAGAVAALAPPPPASCSAVAAADAIGALLAACAERIDACAGTLRASAVLLETARHDYAHVEAAASQACSATRGAARDTACR